MIDFLTESRQAMIDNFQISFRAIRNLMGYSAAELADFVGVTRQTINNLETGKAKMSPVQYIAIAAVVDNYIISNGEMFNAIETIIDGKKRNENYDTSFSNLSLLKRWFACFNYSYELGGTTISFDNAEDYHLLLQRLAARYKIFVDADVLITHNADKFIVSLADCLIAENARLIIPMRAIEQIQDMLQDVSFSEKAVKALKLANSLQRKNAVQLRGEDRDSNIHDTILSVFAKFRSLHRLCLITQNDIFAEEVNRLNESSEKQGFDILVGYINNDGLFAQYPKQGESLAEATAELNDKTYGEGELTIKETSACSESPEVSIEVGPKPALTGWGQL